MAMSDLLKLLSHKEIQAEMRDFLDSSGWKVAHAILEVHANAVVQQLTSCTSPHDMAIHVGRLKALRELPQLFEAYSQKQTTPSPGSAS